MCMCVCASVHVCARVCVCLCECACICVRGQVCKPTEFRFVERLPKCMFIVAAFEGVRAALMFL